MTIHTFSDVATAASIESVSVNNCIFCQFSMADIFSDGGTKEIGVYGINVGPGTELWSEKVKHCLRCGWWARRKETHSEVLDHTSTSGFKMIAGSAGSLKNLDITSAVDAGAKVALTHLWCMG